MSMHKGMLGKIGPASADLTLADYIQRKTRDDAFNVVKAEQIAKVRDMEIHGYIESRADGSVAIPGNGEELVLRPDGQWFYNDTSGG